ncbi:MAG TPA: class I SAM-dependent methyltransferase [Chloroflexi bacterium]|jgi:SAM-dependent methyltransferase|nr:class I SAM-dependent methyltransferase [Chloroflexota bacterium]
MDPRIEANLRHWDDLVDIHARSTFYNLEGFLRGETNLLPIERQEIGDIAGKSILHLQCHFGMGTLSLARMGAKVTGMDFSPRAIALARQLAQELGLEADFVQANLYDLPNVLHRSYDMVYTTYGVLCWLPDIEGWARVVSHFVAPGGTFYMVEEHPFSWVFEQEGRELLQPRNPYFARGKAHRYDEQGSYADADATIEHTETYEWQHTLGDIVSALAAAGLRIEYLHEFPYLEYELFPGMVCRQDGYYDLPEGHPEMPLLFSIKARKE